MQRSECDVLVLGAGFAGAAAACGLGERGASVVVLEARERVGGRGYARAFGDGGPVLEFGGAWITPWHERVRHWAGESGIELRPRHVVTGRRYHDGEVLREGEPTSTAARPDYAAAMARIREDAGSYDSSGAGASATVGLSLNQYLDRIGASPEARAQVMAWWTISGNGDPDVVAATEFLSSCAYGGGNPEGMLDKLMHTLDPGSSALVERMIAKSGATLKRNAVARSVEQNAEGVVVTTADGDVYRARFAVCCLPLNALADVSFQPPLPKRKTQAARIGHAGDSVKVWIEAEGVALGIIATGGGSGLQWMFSERRTARGTTMIVCFGFRAADFDPSKRGDIARALARFFPEARLVAWDWHDWRADPYAKGTWVALPASATWIADHREWLPEGRIAFATSDTAADSAGWFEAAILSGEEAARTIASRMAL